MATQVYFEYKIQGGSTWTETTKQTITVTQDYELDMSNLDMGTNYEYRAIVNDDGCINSGETMTFFTWSEEINSFDSLRRLLLDDIYNGDSLRKLSLDEINEFDTLRKLILSETTNFDTLRKIAYGGYFSGKTYRSIVKYYEELFDSLRKLAIDENINFDSLRALILSEVVDFDSLRLLIMEDSANFDTLRKLVVLDESDYDTLRKLIDDSKFSTGLLRILRSATAEEDEEEMETCFVFFNSEESIVGEELDVTGYSDCLVEVYSKFGSTFETIFEGTIDQNFYPIMAIKSSDLSLINNPTSIGTHNLDVTGLKKIRCSLNSVLFDKIRMVGNLFKEKD